MTTIYYVRHAEPNYENHDDQSRELSKKGLQDSQSLVNFFSDVPISTAYSSPYKRAMDTISPTCQSKNLSFTILSDLRERKITDDWIEDFSGFAQKQWADFSYRLPGGESLSEVQTRSISLIQQLVNKHPGKTILLGGHGTTLSTILNFYNSSLGFQSFQDIKHVFPLVVRFDFGDAGEFIDYQILKRLS